MKDNLPSQPCLNCHAGRKTLRTATLMTWIGEELITVPNFPAWICDICGERAYDTHALVKLNLLLNPEAGTPVQPKSPAVKKNPPINTPPPA